MTNMALWLVLLGGLFFSFGFQASSTVSSPTMTEEQAVSAVRARSGSASDAEFVVAFKIEPTPETKEVAQQSLAEARSKQITLYEDGLFVELLRAGGYLVLEFNGGRAAPNRLCVVTLNSTGEYDVHCNDIHGNLTKDQAQTVINNSAKFSKAFFESPVTPIRELLVTFGGPEAAAIGIPDGQGYLAVPENVKRLSRDQGESLELTSLANGIALWSIRHALEMPVYAANPVVAVQQANKRLSELSQEFRQGLDTDRLLDLEPIRTDEELVARVKSLRELSSFLDKRSPLQVNSAAYKANIAISAVPLDLVVEHDSAQFYGATSVPGLMTVWIYGKTGEPVLKGLSVAE
jgi:hypothetical protein